VRHRRHGSNVAKNNCMAQRPPRACYIPQQIPQRGPPVYRNHKGTAYPDPAGKGHDRSCEHHSHQNRNAPDYNNIMQALTMIQNNMKTTAETMQTTASTGQRTAAASNQAILISQETKAITKEVAEAGKAAAVILQETNNIAKAIQSAPSPKSLYAPVLSSNLASISRPITISTYTLSLI